MKNKMLIAMFVILIALLSIVIVWKSFSNTTSSASTVLTPIEPLSAVEISGKITSIYENPDKLVVAASDGNSYMLLVDASTSIIRDVGGTVGGTFIFNSFRVGDIVAVKGNANHTGNAITPSLVEQINSQGID